MANVDPMFATTVGTTLQTPISKIKAHRKQPVSSAKRSMPQVPSGLPRQTSRPTVQDQVFLEPLDATSSSSSTFAAGGAFLAAAGLTVAAISSLRKQKSKKEDNFDPEQPSESYQNATAVPHTKALSLEVQAKKTPKIHRSTKPHTMLSVSSEADETEEMSQQVRKSVWVVGRFVSCHE